MADPLPPRRPTRLALALVPLALAAGCASTPDLDARFGDEVRQSIARQVIDPGAGQRPAKDAFVDAGVARAIVERHQEGFKAPPPTFEILNIGGASSGR